MRRLAAAFSAGASSRTPAFPRTLPPSKTPIHLRDRTNARSSICTAAASCRSQSESKLSHIHITPATDTLGEQKYGARDSRLQPRLRTRTAALRRRKQHLEMMRQLAAAFSAGEKPRTPAFPRTLPPSKTPTHLRDRTNARSSICTAAASCRSQSESKLSHSKSALRLDKAGSMNIATRPFCCSRPPGSAPPH